MFVTLRYINDMKARGKGHICNIASAAGMLSLPKMSLYAASKWGAVAWSDSMRIELQREKSPVRVTTIAPYFINTGMFDGIRSFFKVLKPETVARKTVNWASDKAEVATVDNQGSVHAVAPGEAIITVTTTDGGKTATCTVTVKAALPTDALSGEFSVSGTKKVHFSQGNLVATINASGTPTAWKFAANQYDYIGSATANTSIGSTAGDIDLFGWSTAATKYGISTSTTSLSDYSGDFVDWGTAIDDKGTWRTLTTAEWQYLFNRRSNASSLYKNGVTVCGKENCLIIAPDNWDTSAKPLNASYDATAWATAEAAGLVCLPAAGRRRGSDVGYVGDRGYYWSSTAFDGNYAYYVVFNSSDVCSDDCDYRSRGFSVRLITESK